jgi:putative phage-type endonuclease
MIQGSPEWFAERCGKVTASRISDVIAKVKTGEAAGRINYRAQLVAERLTGKPAESFSNAAMQWGTDTEPYARMAYEAHTGIFVKEVGFITHPTIEGAGASPDGLAETGLVEIKCPNTATHIDYFLSGVAPEKYKPQMAWQCACTGREWVDFVSYDPRLPENMQLLVTRYTPEPEYIKTLEQEVIKFLGEVENLIEQLNRKAA